MSGWGHHAIHDEVDAITRAVAGTDGTNAQIGFVNDLAIYPMTGEELMLTAGITGTKYCKGGKLDNLDFTSSQDGEITRMTVSGVIRTLICGSAMSAMGNSSI